MCALLPCLALYRRHKRMLNFDIVLTIVTLLANIGLLTLPGQLLLVSVVTGVAGLYSFNYILPAADVCGATITRTAGRYLERLISHDATFHVLQHLHIHIFNKLLPLPPAGLARYRQGELLNRVVTNVDMLDHLYLRVILPLVGAFMVIMVVTIGLGFLDFTLAFTLGGIMLLTLFLMPLLFYRAGKSTGRSLTHLREQYRQQLTVRLQGQAELTIFGTSDCYRMQLENTEIRQLEAQYRRSKLTVLPQAIMLLVGALAVILMLWMTSGGVGGNAQPGTLIALFVFCALAAFEALAPVTGAFQHLGQVIASAVRTINLTDQRPEVTFPDTQTHVADRVSLALRDVQFTYLEQSQQALKGISLQVNAGEYIVTLGRARCGRLTLLQLLTHAWGPQQGEILLNDSPMVSLNEAALRQTVSVVPRRMHLFNTTLHGNLLLVSPGSSDEALTESLRRVGLEKLLGDAGLNSWLGEDGCQLSGGEPCCLATAHMLLHDTPSVLLDEPTEGLDATTESQILELLVGMMCEKTALMVTH